jgi:hypothetical protein
MIIHLPEQADCLVLAEGEPIERSLAYLDAVPCPSGPNDVNRDVGIGAYGG